jgi:hypothetical protein
LEIPRKEGIDLPKEVIPVGVKGEKGIIEIPLENTVGAIHRTIGDGVHHIVTAADMPGGSWAWLQTPSIKSGDEKIFFPHPYGILHGEKLLDQGSLIFNPFNRDMGKTP